MNVAQSIINHVVLDRIFIFFLFKGGYWLRFFHFVRSSFVNFHFVRVFSIVKQNLFRKVRSFSKKTIVFFSRSFNDLKSFLFLIVHKTFRSFNKTMPISSFGGWRIKDSAYPGGFSSQRSFPPGTSKSLSPPLEI